MGFGNIVGSGIFTLTGPAAHMTGSSVILSFVFTGLISMMTALQYAEFASIIPKSGSSYLYTQCIFGEFAAWIMAWNLIFLYGIETALETRGLAAYSQKFL